MNTRSTLPFGTHGRVVGILGRVRDGSAEKGGRQLPARPRLLLEKGFKGPSSPIQRRHGSGLADTGLLPAPFELEGLPKGVSKAGDGARHPRPVAGGVLCAAPKVTVVLSKASGQVDGRPNVRPATDGASQAVDGDGLVVVGRWLCLVERHLALPSKKFLVGYQPTPSKAGCGSHLVPGWGVAKP